MRRLSSKEYRALVFYIRRIAASGERGRTPHLLLQRVPAALIDELQGVAWCTANQVFWKQQGVRIAPCQSVPAWNRSCQSVPARVSQ